MEALCGLFSFVSGFNELVSRSEDKNQELIALQSSIQSIHESVETFASGLGTAEERLEAFHSNSVFAQMSEHLQKCKEILSRHGQQGAGQAPALADGQASSSFRSIRRNLVAQGSRTVREGLEVLGGQIGALSGAALPEDELENMKKAASELQRLVPQLLLAIQVFRPRGQKRALDGAPLDQDVYRRMLSGDRLALPPAVTNEERQLEIPQLQLKLISDWSNPGGEAMAEMVVTDLRSGTCAMSSSSLDSGVGAATPSKPEVPTRRLVFGRAELKGRVPETLVMAPSPGKEAVPVSRFVGREHFILEVPAVKPVVDEEDTLNMATLAWGGESSGHDELLAPTLAFGCDGLGALPAPKPLEPLAEVLSLRSEGIYLRTVGSVTWTWLGKGAKAEVRAGDRIGILVQPTRGSFERPTHDFSALESVCVLAVDVFGAAKA